ncbi:DUF2635 domain-containing protein [Desulfocurvibacter africanus]|uniref:DUF2635 domain-containing protein n=1 Tax=Desulfocurvibacter africanus TaxID=873 RepID=UPI00040DE26B|nr:DUF2635 domain-containing protein [Desulfocurvibacter africanus]
MKTVFVTPRAGLQVRDERGRAIPAEGKDMARTAYVLRRIQDGDLVEGNPEQRVQAESAPEPEAKPRKGRKE